MDYPIGSHVVVFLNPLFSFLGERHSNKLQMEGAQILRKEAYIEVLRNKPAPLKSGEGYSATQQMDF
ncbi:MAG: hypothetical protein A2Y79_10575 [Deltaproteobacteria bacterium RBG_13_43_22]|jgi:hypothetical protein|nr:MAG: hypothetical protein A2Y79_10575 [Deltaproteobacteria bacterium RBG_13_43_22]